MASTCTCCALDTLGTARICRTSVWTGSDMLNSGREQIWQRKTMMERPISLSAPLQGTPLDLDDDDTCAVCSEVDLLDNEIMSSEAQPTPVSRSFKAQSQPISSSSKALPIYAPFSKKVELFRLRSERHSDSDDEEDILGFEAEDRADTLNSLLVLEEREEGIRRYRSSIDDEDRLAHSQSMKREADLPLLVEKENPHPSDEALTPDRDSRPQVKSSFISQRPLCLLVAVAVGLSFTALWRNNHSNSASPFMAAGIEPRDRGLSSDQSIDQRPGSLRLENLQTRNRLSFF
eukprot:gnl/MRDRNA2_/MRDRNA2_115862_c0_seq1.p1 gnl/MRDRNA2_/MRDRNA2_115862_c0~~gnl/MRDRNA2_/MRDRNA2_115862_c0_seq1.p1  ORF type:complete len:327 (-),score=48.23 gnl/MRDRNA2_/MRDRNA2_115862_c0_seq1:87-956(-)